MYMTLLRAVVQKITATMLLIISSAVIIMYFLSHDSSQHVDKKIITLSNDDNSFLVHNSIWHSYRKQSGR